MNTTTRAQRINKRYDAIWSAYMELVATTKDKDTQAQEKPRTEAPDAGTGQFEAQP